VADDSLATAAGALAAWALAALGVTFLRLRWDWRLVVIRATPQKLTKSILFVKTTNLSIHHSTCGGFAVKFQRSSITNSFNP
jgi:hypothetical protein